MFVVIRWPSQAAVVQVNDDLPHHVLSTSCGRIRMHAFNPVTGALLSIMQEDWTTYLRCEIYNCTHPKPAIKRTVVPGRLRALSAHHLAVDQVELPPVLHYDGIRLVSLCPISGHLRSVECLDDITNAIECGFDLTGRWFAATVGELAISVVFYDIARKQQRRVQTDIIGTASLVVGVNEALVQDHLRGILFHVTDRARAVCRCMCHPLGFSRFGAPIVSVEESGPPSVIALRGLHSIDPTASVSVSVSRDGKVQDVQRLPPLSPELEAVYLLICLQRTARSGQLRFLPDLVRHLIVRVFLYA